MKSVTSLPAFGRIPAIHSRLLVLCISFHKRQRMKLLRLMCEEEVLDLGRQKGGRLFLLYLSLTLGMTLLRVFSELTLEMARQRTRLLSSHATC